MGRLSGRNSFSNPFELLSPKFTNGKKSKWQLADRWRHKFGPLVHRQRISFLRLELQAEQKNQTCGVYTRFNVERKLIFKYQNPLNIGATYESMTT